MSIGPFFITHRDDAKKELAHRLEAEAFQSIVLRRVHKE